MEFTASLAVKAVFVRMALTGLAGLLIYPQRAEASWSALRCKIQCTRNACIKDAKRLASCESNCNPDRIKACLGARPASPSRCQDLSILDKEIGEKSIQRGRIRHLLKSYKPGTPKHDFLNKELDGVSKELETLQENMNICKGNLVGAEKARVPPQTHSALHSPESSEKASLGDGPTALPEIGKPSDQKTASIIESKPDTASISNPHYLDQIKQGVPLKKTAPAKSPENVNPSLLDQIRQGVSLRNTGQDKARLAKEKAAEHKRELEEKAKNGDLLARVELKMIKRRESIAPVHEESEKQWID